MQITLEPTSSTKNKDRSRDPGMHQTRKGNQWYFGTNAHTGIDSQSRLIHSVVATSANVNDFAVLDDLLHGDATRVWGDSAYAGQTDRIKQVAPHARGFIQKKGSRYRKLTDAQRLKNKTKSKVRVRVEHRSTLSKTGLASPKSAIAAWRKHASLICELCASQYCHGQKRLDKTKAVDDAGEVRLKIGLQALIGAPRA